MSGNLCEKKIPDLTNQNCQKAQIRKGAPDKDIFVVMPEFENISYVYGFTAEKVCLKFLRSEVTNN